MVLEGSWTPTLLLAVQSHPTLWAALPDPRAQLPGSSPGSEGQALQETQDLKAECETDLLRNAREPFSLLPSFLALLFGVVRALANKDFSSPFPVWFLD